MGGPRTHEYKEVFPRATSAYPLQTGRFVVDVRGSVKSRGTDVPGVADRWQERRGRMSEGDSQGAGAPPSPEARAGFARNAFNLLLGQVGTTALAIVQSAALGRSLGAADFGLYFLVTSMATFGYVFVEWGQPLFVIREVARSPGRAGELLGSALVLRLAFAAAISIPAYLTAWLLGYDARTCGLSVLFIATSLPYFLAQAYGMVFRARDRMGKDAVVSIANKALGLALVLAALSLGGNLIGIAIALALAGTAALALARWLYGRMDAPPVKVTRERAREILLGGLPIIAMSAAVAAQPYLDAVLLSKLAPANTVGWYGAARNILGTLIAPAVILGAAAYPRLSRAASDPALFHHEVRGALRPMLLLGALGGTGTYLFADFAVSLIYGKSEYGPAAAVLRWFSPGMFLLFVDMLLSNVLLAAGRPRGFAIAKILSVAVSTVLAFLLIPFFQERYGNGGIGIVVAFALSELVVFVGVLFIIPRGTFDADVPRDFARALTAGGATALAIGALPPLAPLLAIPLCITLFGACSFALGLIRRDDLALVKSLVSPKPTA